MSRTDGVNRTYELSNALDVVLDRKAGRFINSVEYLSHIRKCVDSLELVDPKLAFLFGGLDAMQQDFGSAAQMVRPPGSRLDVSSRKNRLARLMKWKKDWQHRNILPFADGR
jgi:hypothetical protein